MARGDDPQAREVVFERVGRGLHSGAPAAATIVAPEVGESGLGFEVAGRAVRCGPGLVTALGGALATDLHGEIRTVEHWLAALVGTGRAATIVIRTGSELPGMAGDALQLSQALHRSALPELQRWCPPHRIEVEHQGSRARWLPGRGDRLEVTYEIDFPSPVIGRQSLNLVLDPDCFVEEIASARTFTVADSLAEVARRQAAGIGAGLGPGEALVAGPLGWLHGEPRWADEAVRHKILDLLGDLGVLGIRPTGALLVQQGGHRLHHALARAAVGA